MSYDPQLCVTWGCTQAPGGYGWDTWDRLWSQVQFKHIHLRTRWVKYFGGEHPELFMQYDLDVTDCFGSCCAGKLALLKAAWGGGGTT